jgi:hypothetical protein
MAVLKNLVEYEVVEDFDELPIDHRQLRCLSREEVFVVPVGRLTDRHVSSKPCCPLPSYDVKDGSRLLCADLPANELLQVCRITVTHNFNLGERVRYLVQIISR